MFCSRSALAIGLFFSSVLSCFAAQTVRQEENQLLYPPQLITSGDGRGHQVPGGFEIASLPSIPLSATIEAESQITDAKGNTTVHRRISKIARDSKGRTRTEIDFNEVGSSIDPRLVNIHISDAAAKIDITLFPWNQTAFRIEQEDNAEPAFAPEAAPIPQPAPVEPKEPRSMLPLAMPITAPASKPMFVEPPELGRGRRPEPRIEREELGIEVIDGRHLRHGRETARYPAGFAGNKDAFTVVTDYWYSQDLQSFVLVKQVDSRTGVQTLRLKNILRENPEPALFEIPKDYKVQRILMKAPETLYVL